MINAFHIGRDFKSIAHLKAPHPYVENLIQHANCLLLSLSCMNSSMIDTRQNYRQYTIQYTFTKYT